LGISFSYDNTFTGEKTPPNLSAASGSVDELKYSMKDMFVVMNLVKLSMELKMHMIMQNSPQEGMNKVIRKQGNKKILLSQMK